MKSAEGRRPSALNRAYSSVPELYDTPASPATLRKLVLSWYRGSGRDLPWRRTRDPYRVLVSEVMLQQTQVSRVLPAYRRFLPRVPPLPGPPPAPPRKGLPAWAGPCYNPRARGLHPNARPRPPGLAANPARPHALSRVRGAILRQLVSSPRGVTMATLRRGINDPRVARLVGVLAQEGLVEVSSGSVRLPTG